MVVQLQVRGRTLDITGTLVMGVVNASPESFSDGGRYRSPADRIALAEHLVAAGADILDVGGQSAVTGEPELAAAQEIERVLPIVEWLARNHPEVLISVDTYKPAVAQAAVAAGAAIVNDVSGLLYPEVAGICAAAGAALVVMHNRARPKVRLQDPGHYADVVADVVSFLAARMEAAVAAGLPREALIVDPGPDFTKTPHQTLAVLRRLEAVRGLGRPVLLALSRKDFVGAILSRSPRGRDAGSMAALAVLAAVPGNIARVHDVAMARDVVGVVEHLMGRQDIAADYLLPDQLRHDRG
ncbi:MAG TPA: dihydropteroate synthase [Sporichthyaceae bacterium]|nr:dihydropteroate synthase [Sporichthyaceae bacterium]